ncbi:MAG TPA: GxxExxY protein, partial [Candidatus Hydrogenedentes bacterium]|nr:GxxExxY protein [Candidatus Hydrogenedentota bacterium]
MDLIVSIKTRTNSYGDTGNTKIKSSEQNERGSIIVDCAVALHRETGPGLLETVYEAVLARDLEARGLRMARQVPIPIELRGLQFDEGFR